MARLTVIYWRDIPAQVIGQQGRRRQRQELPARFAAAIDRAAMRAGRGGSSAYLDDWRRETRTCAGDIAAAVREEAERLEAGFPEPYLEAVVKAGGHAVTREDSE